MIYKIIIEDFGIVHEGSNQPFAKAIFERYINFVQSRKVYLINHSGEVIAEFFPKDK